MNKTYLLALLLLVLAAPTHALVTSYPDGRAATIVTGMTSPSDRWPPCIIYDREYHYADGTPYHYILQGIVGKSSWDGRDICFVPHRGGGNKKSVTATSDGGNNGGGSDENTGGNGGGDLPGGDDGEVDLPVCHDETTCDDPVCSTETTCEPATCKEQNRKCDRWKHVDHHTICTKWIPAPGCAVWNDPVCHSTTTCDEPVCNTQQVCV